MFPPSVPVPRLFSATKVVSSLRYANQVCKMNEQTGFSWKKVKVTRGTLVLVLVPCLKPVLHPLNWMGNGADCSFVCSEGQLDYKSLNYQNSCCFLVPPLSVPHQTLPLNYLPCKSLWLLFRCCETGLAVSQETHRWSSRN